MLEGTGEATVAVAPAAAFAFLSDPRNAASWFAGADFAVAPEGPPRAGLRWSFARTPGTRRVTPVCMVTFTPPQQFVWETQLPRWRTNFTWELSFAPASEEQPGGTRLRMAIRLRPGLVEWPSALVGYALVRRALGERAQRTVERASEAIPTPQRPAQGSGGRGRRPKRR
jgi:hypothetical protein